VTDRLSREPRSLSRKRAAIAIGAIFFAIAPSAGRASFRTDSLALYGAWSWVSTAGSYSGVIVTPIPGWNRVLFFRRDGTYCLWEEDSIASYELCSGEFSIHPARNSRIGSRIKPNLWVELKGWWWRIDDRQLVGFSEPDRIALYPGYEDDTGAVEVMDASTSSFARLPHVPVPAPGHSPGDSPVYRAKPPRLQLTSSLLAPQGSDYDVELARPLMAIRRQTNPIRLWSESAYPRAIRDRYEYQTFQVPSALIGDFDGDSIPDAAIYGHIWDSASGTQRSRIECFLSNPNDPRAVLLWADSSDGSATSGSGHASGGREGRLPDSYLTAAGSMRCASPRAPIDGAGLNWDAATHAPLA
jgi:hypothetical protein